MTTNTHTRLSKPCIPFTLLPPPFKVALVTTGLYTACCCTQKSVFPPTSSICNQPSQSKRERRAERGTRGFTKEFFCFYKQTILLCDFSFLFFFFSVCNFISFFFCSTCWGGHHHQQPNGSTLPTP